MSAATPADRAIDHGLAGAGGVPTVPPGLPIPLGRRIDLPGRGTTFVREVPGPAPRQRPGPRGPVEAPTLVLLHGWLASGGTNWFRVFEPLGRHFRVLAPDLRGHARGLRSRRRFRLADCADDVAALLDVLGIRSAIAVGYSMGGPVAQLLWRRHRGKVDGLVLCATSHSFVPGARERLVFTSAMAAAVGTTRLGGMLTAWPSSLARYVLPVGSRPTNLQRWAAAEVRRHDWRLVLEAGHAVGRYDARRWVGEIDVPTAVVVTTHDHAILPPQQHALARAIPGATTWRVEEGHTVCASPRFVEPLVGACIEVAERAHPGWVADRANGPAIGA